MQTPRNPFLFDVPRHSDHLFRSGSTRLHIAQSHRAGLQRGLSFLGILVIYALTLAYGPLEYSGALEGTTAREAAASSPSVELVLWRQAPHEK